MYVYNFQQDILPERVQLLTGKFVATSRCTYREK